MGSEDLQKPHHGWDDQKDQISRNLNTGQYSGHRSCFFPHPAVEGTCFLPLFFARACGLGEEFISISTKIGVKRQKFRVLPSLKLQNDLNWEERGRSREEIWEIGEIFHCQMKFFVGQELFSSPISQDS